MAPYIVGRKCCTMCQVYGKSLFDDLPKALVHGDFTKGNVLVNKEGQAFIIDFSVTNWTVRIIELDSFFNL